MKEALKQVYSVRIESPFILTPTEVKKHLGIGFKVVSVEVAKDVAQAPITDVDSAAEAIVKTGYRALARAHHPDLGGDPNTMKILNQSKSEMLELLKQLRSI